MIKTIKKFFAQNKTETLLLVAILLMALFLRLYKIDQYLTFLGDEGRDVRIVRDLITKGNLVFIGPQTSIGNMYLGPLYYYMMAPALILSGLNPVGPAVMVAILGVVTVWLTWFVARNWFGREAAFISALLFAVSPVAIIYSRSSWNPNPMPFFALLSMWGIYRLWHFKEFKHLITVAVSLAFALQMHYLGLMLIPALGLFWFLTFWQVRQKQDQKRNFFRQSLIGLGLFLLLMSPLVLFDLKHSGMNFNAFKSFFSDRQTTVNLNPARSDRFLPVAQLAVTDLVLSRKSDFSTLTLITIMILSILAFKRTKNRSAVTVLFVWIGFALLGLGVYKQHVYVHYLGFIYPAVYLLLGLLLGFLLRQQMALKFISVIAILFLFLYSFQNSPLKQTPNRQLWRTEAAVDLIIKESAGKPFNFGLIAKQNYDESYRYFLENKNARLVRGEDGITGQLFVICEDGDKCQPEGNPQWQIAIFGPSKIKNVWTIDYLKIYQLEHNPY